MKKQVSDFVKSLGGTAAYSGNTRTMYIHNDNIEQPIAVEVAKQFPRLEFEIVTQ